MGIGGEEIAVLCPKKSREAAHAFRAQAEDFFDAAIAMGSRNLYAKPLLLYYAFLNLSRAFLLTRSYSQPTERPQHGISERARIRQVEGTRLTVHPSDLKKPQLFDQLLKALTGHGLKARRSYRLGYLMPQILFGHRVWCSASMNTNDSYRSRLRQKRKQNVSVLRCYMVGPEELQCIGEIDHLGDRWRFFE